MRQRLPCLLIYREDDRLDVLIAIALALIVTPATACGLSQKNCRIPISHSAKSPIVLFSASMHSGLPRAQGQGTNEIKRRRFYSKLRYTKARTKGSVRKRLEAGGLPMTRKLILSSCAIVIFFLTLAQSASAQVCRGGISYTFPDGRSSYTQYWIETRQRYPGDCFLPMCPAECSFKTLKPARDDSSRKVKLRIEPDRDKNGYDYCFIQNNNNRSVVAYVDVFPSGMLPNSPNHGSVGPITLEKHTVARIFGWFQPSGKPSCTLISSQYL